MNLLVTGAAGYIGASFSYEALKKGFKVYGCDNFINSDETNIKTLENKFPNDFRFEKICLNSSSISLFINRHSFPENSMKAPKVLIM